MLLHGHGSAVHGEAVALLKQRAVAPGAWFLAHCGEKLTAAELSDEGNRFAQSYYLHDEDRFEAGDASYLSDYLGRFPQSYATPDDWDSYDRLVPILAHRFALWRGMEKGRG